MTIKKERKYYWLSDDDPCCDISETPINGWLKCVKVEKDGLFWFEEV